MDPALQSMINNLPANTGRSLEQWFAVLDENPMTKHSDILARLKRDYGVTHGYANGIALQYRSRGVVTPDDDLVDAQYQGAKTALRPVYESLVAIVQSFGDDVQVSAKKSYVSLRRSKQFGLIEPASSKRIQLGLNLGAVVPTARLLSATGMCTHKVSITDLVDVDDELIGWLRSAYVAA